MSARVGAVGILVLLLALPAWAHRPIETDEPHTSWEQAQEVEQPDVSQVIYRELSPQEPALWLSFEASAGQEILFGLGVPRIERLSDFQPEIAVVGPGFPAAELPVALPPGAGALVLVPPGPAREFHEPITGTDSRILVELKVRFEDAGTYYLVAFVPPPQPPAGKLWVSNGELERWGMGDLARLPQIVDEVRAFHEIAPFPWWVPISIGTALVAGGGVLLALWLLGVR